MQNFKINSKLKLVFFILTILLCEYIFFRNVMFNDNLIGNYVDGKLNMLFVDHWYQVFCGKEFWKDLICFYPAQNVLSYSDMMLGFAMPYSILRLLGLNMFIAFKYSLILVHIVGSYALCFFVRKCLKCTSLCSLLATIGFSYSCGYYYIVTNPQMIALSFIPLILICIYYYTENFNKPIRHIYALIGLAIFILLFYTAFYVAYFSIIFIILYMIFFILTDLFARVTHLRLLFKNIFSHWKDFLCYMIFCIILMLPFIELYLPTFTSFGGREWFDILLFAPNIYNILNLEISNPLGFDLTIYPRKFGFPIIMLALYVISFICYIIHIIKNKKDGEKNKFQHTLIVSLFFTLILSLFLVVNWNGSSLWYVLYKLLPGASAIRVLERWPVFIVLPFSIFLAYTLDKSLASKKWIYYTLLPIILLIVFSCNYSKIGICTDWTVCNELYILENVSTPPTDCEIIYITDKTNKYISEDFANENLQMYAWLIANKYNLKTVNGYSGQTPPNWDLFIGSADIDIRVLRWLKSNNIYDKIVYAYDIGTNTWTQLHSE